MVLHINCFAIKYVVGHYTHTHAFIYDTFCFAEIRAFQIETTQSVLEVYI